MKKMSFGIKLSTLVFIVLLFLKNYAYGEEAREHFSKDKCNISFHFVTDKNNSDSFKMTTANGKEELCLENTPCLTFADVFSAKLDPINMSPKMAKVFKNMGMTTPRYQVLIEFTQEGKSKLYKTTSENINKRLGIIVDGKLLMAPVIREAISGGQISIQGSMSEEEMKTLVERINKAKLH